MRKMLLGIYLALLGIASLILSLLSAGWFGFVLTAGLFLVSAYFTLDGFFTWGPKAREDGEDSKPPLPPQYK